MGFNMLLTAALLLLYLSAACEAQGQGIDERPALVGRAKTAAGWKEELVLVRQDEWMQEGGGVLGEGRSRHEAGRAADLGVGFREASESGQELEQRARAKQGRPVSWREKEIGLVEKRNYDEQSLVVGDALSSRPDVHFLVEGSLQGVPGGEFEGPEGNGGVLSSMQLESGERFGHPVLGRNHTSKAFSRSRGEALAAVAGKFQDGTQEREASKSNARQPSVTTAGLDDSRVLQPRRHVLNAEQSTGWGASDDSVASTLWHLLPLTQGRSQWERGPAFSWSNPSKPALRLARRIHQRLQRARVLAEENAAGVPAENTLHRRYSKLEGFAPGPAPLPALGTSSPASNPGFAPNPAPASAPIPGPAAGPALAPAPASLPPAPSCPNITIPGLTPSPDRKTAYSDALALAAIKLVASNLTATKNWRGDDPCNNDWPRVLCEQQADGLLYVVQLDLSYMFLGGAIAPGICQLSKLRYLSLAGNNISGNLPASLGAMPRLQVLHLYDNNLTGPLPPELGWLSQLEELRAETNRLNGTVPASLGALQNLVLLSLSQNQLSGQIPPSLGRSQNLMIMRINNNGLIGSLPASLTDLINLQELDLSFNNLTGPIWPYLLGKLSRVQTLRLNNNNLTGPLDSTVGDMRALQTLELSNNKLQGTLPTRLSELHNLQYVSIRNNQLTGSIPKELGYNSNINYLMLSNNTLNGYLPDALGNILNLQELWLDGNQFSGPLPSGLGNLAQLKKMHLENNFFTGALPDNFNGLSYLQELWLDNNALSDPLNPLLAQCSSLSVLSMNNNSLTGSLPDEYGDISTLTYVSLANNSLMGPIPLTFGNPTGLRVIALQNNQLNGTIPPTLGKLTYLQQLWLQNNSLEGAIPAQLGNLKNVDLRLDGNLNMCGPFFPKACPSPPGVAPSPSPQCPACPPASDVQSWTGSCACVDALTLHFRFGTKLPFDSARKELLSLSLANGLGIQRQQVNLVGNVTYNGTNAYMTVNVLPLGNMSLTEGQIRAMVRGLKSRSVALPESMQDVTKYEVVGVEVPPDISLTDPKPSSAVIAGAAVGAVAALVLVLCTVSFFLHNRLKHAREKRASLEEGGSFDGSIESDDQETQRRRFSTFLLKCLAKAPCKNRGGTMQTGGSEWAREMDYWELRRATSNFGRSRLIGEGGFGRVYRARMDDGSVLAVKRLNEKSSQGESEFWAEVSTLGRLAHPHLVKLVGYCSHRGERLVAYEYMPKGSLKDYLHGYGSQKAILDWATRMRIVVGAAEGLAFLHAAIPSVIHRDFKSSNILLDGDLGARVADFGLAREGPSEPVTHVSTQVRGTLGYSAPEYVMSGRLTTKSDVYSFGVVLLELITGRTCVDPLQPPGMEYLVDWAKPKLGVTEKLLKIVDPDIASRVPVEQLLRLASVAASCLRSKPHDRPSMGAVLDHLLPLIMSPLPSPRADLLEPGLPYSPPQTGALLTAQESSHQYEPGGETGTLSRTQSWGSAESFETAEVGSPWHARYSFGPRLVMSDSSMQEKAREQQRAPEGGGAAEHRSY